MGIEIYNRSFVMNIPNAAKEAYLHISCTVDRLGGLAQFIRYDALGFKELRGSDDYVGIPHKVISKEGVLQAPEGKILYQIIDRQVVFKPLNGLVPDQVFTVSLDELAGVLVRETNQRRWDDYCLGAIEHNGKIYYLYTHLMFDDLITITDRSSFYAELQNKDAQWTPSNVYFTSVVSEHTAIRGSVMRDVLDWQRNLKDLMHANDFNTMADVKKHFNIF